MSGVTNTITTPLSIEALDEALRERIQTAMDSIVEEARAHRAKVVETPADALTAARESIVTDYVTTLAAVQVIEASVPAIVRKAKTNLFSEPASELRFRTWAERVDPIIRDLNMVVAEVGSLVYHMGTQIALRELGTAQAEAAKAQAEVEKLKARLAASKEAAKPKPEPTPAVAEPKAEEPKVETPKPNGRKGNGQKAPEAKPEVTTPEPAAETPKAEPFTDADEKELAFHEKLLSMSDAELNAIGQKRADLKRKADNLKLKALRASNAESMSPEMEDKLAKDKPAPAGGGPRRAPKRR